MHLSLLGKPNKLPCVSVLLSPFIRDLGITILVAYFVFMGLERTDIHETL